jgi:hypothetical protein
MWHGTHFQNEIHPLTYRQIKGQTTSEGGKQVELLRQVRGDQGGKACGLRLKGGKAQALGMAWKYKEVSSRKQGGNIVAAAPKSDVRVNAERAGKRLKACAQGPVTDEPEPGCRIAGNQLCSEVEEEVVVLFRNQSPHMYQSET